MGVPDGLVYFVIRASKYAVGFVIGHAPGVADNGQGEFVRKECAALRGEVGQEAQGAPGLPLVETRQIAADPFGKHGIGFFGEIDRQGAALGFAVQRCLLLDQGGHVRDVDTDPDPSVKVFDREGIVDFPCRLVVDAEGGQTRQVQPFSVRGWILGGQPGGLVDGRFGKLRIDAGNQADRVASRWQQVEPVQNLEGGFVGVLGVAIGKYFSDIGLFAINKELEECPGESGRGLGGAACRIGNSFFLRNILRPFRFRLVREMAAFEFVQPEMNRLFPLVFLLLPLSCQEEGFNLRGRAGLEGQAVALEAQVVVRENPECCRDLLGSGLTEPEAGNVVDRKILS